MATHPSNDPARELKALWAKAASVYPIWAHVVHELAPVWLLEQGVVRPKNKRGRVLEGHCVLIARFVFANYQQHKAAFEDISVSPKGDTSLTLVTSVFTVHAGSGRNCEIIPSPFTHTRYDGTTESVSDYFDRIDAARRKERVRSDLARWRKSSSRTSVMPSLTEDEVIKHASESAASYKADVVTAIARCLPLRMNNSSSHVLTTLLDFQRAATDAIDAMEKLLDTFGLVAAVSEVFAVYSQFKSDFPETLCTDLAGPNWNSRASEATPNDFAAEAVSVICRWLLTNARLTVYLMRDRYVSRLERMVKDGVDSVRPNPGGYMYVPIKGLPRRTKMHLARELSANLNRAKAPGEAAAENHRIRRIETAMGDFVANCITLPWTHAVDADTHTEVGQGGLRTDPTVSAKISPRRKHATSEKEQFAEFVLSLLVSSSPSTAIDSDDGLEAAEPEGITRYVKLVAQELQHSWPDLFPKSKWTEDQMAAAVVNASRMYKAIGEVR